LIDSQDSTLIIAIVSVYINLYFCLIVEIADLIIEYFFYGQIYYRSGVAKGNAIDWTGMIVAAIDWVFPFIIDAVCDDNSGSEILALVDITDIFYGLIDISSFVSLTC